MSSLVIYGNEFNNLLANGPLPQAFKYRILVEGDSWMDRSAVFQTSLLQKLAVEMDRGHEDTLFINLAMFGDTMRRMGECVKGDFAPWVNSQFGWKFDAILLSAGGNDFIDAARDPGPGQGILFDHKGQAIPATGHACVNQNAVGTLITQWMDPNFEALYACVRNSSRHADVPIFLNNYDTPTARNVPAGKAWLYPSYVKNSIPEPLWPDLTDSIFNQLQMAIAGWVPGRSGLVVVPTDGTLVPAATDAKGSDADWLNEIHPNAGGWVKLAKVWHASIKQVLTP